MESSKTVLNIDSPNLELVLTELLDENRKINLSNTGIVEVVNRLTGKVDGFQEKLGNIKIPTPEIDTRSMTEVVEKGYMDVRQLIDQKLSKIHESNWKVFWMSDAKRWIVYLILGIVLLTYGYLLLHSSDGRQDSF